MLLGQLKFESLARMKVIPRTAEDGRPCPILAFALLMALPQCSHGVQVSQSASGVPLAGPQCWRFEAILPETFPSSPGSQPVNLGGWTIQFETDSMIYVRMARAVLPPTPYMLWPDGRGSLAVPVGGTRVVYEQPPLRWRDAPEGRIVSYESPGFWGHIVTIPDVEASRSRSVARGYTDFGPGNGQVEAWAEQFPCAEETWNPPWPG